MRLSKVVNNRLSKLSDNNYNNFERMSSFYEHKKKNSEIYNQNIKNSKISNRNERNKIMNAKTFKTYSDYNQKNNSINGNTSYDELKIDYKGIEEKIKNTILEMKNNCILENKRQSCDEHEISNNTKMKEDLNEEIKNSIIENAKIEGTNIKRKKKSKKYNWN
jgi:hypothetical protein